MTAGGRGNVQKRVTQSCCFAYLNLFPFCRSLFGSHGIRLHWPFGRGRTGTWEPRRIEDEGYGRRTRKGQEVGVLTEWEVGEIGENYTTVPNVLQSKRD